MLTITLHRARCRNAAATGGAVSSVTSAIMLPPRPPPESLAPRAPAPRRRRDQGIEFRARNAHLVEQSVVRSITGRAAGLPAAIADARGLTTIADPIEQRFEARRLLLPARRTSPTAILVGLAMPLSAMASVNGRPMRNVCGGCPRTK